MKWTMQIHIITLIGLICLEFGRALGSILPLTIDSVFSFVCRTIQSKIIWVLRDSNSRASALLTTEPFCHDTDSLWHKYIAWFLKRQRTCQMKTRNKFCCVCTTGACVNNFLKCSNQIYMSVDLEQTL